MLCFLHVHNVPPLLQHNCSLGPSPSKSKTVSSCHHFYCDLLFYLDNKDSQWCLRKSCPNQSSSHSDFHHPKRNNSSTMLHIHVLVFVLLLFLCQAAVFMFRFLVFLGSWRKTFATAVGVSSIFTSVLFTLVAITLTFLTQHGNELACEAAILTCDFLYTGAKAQLYIFFIERIYIVHKTPTQTRSTSPLYIFNVCLLIPYCGILVLMVLYRVAYVDHNNVCRIGLRNEGALPLLIYDSIFSMYSIAMFVWPLYTMRNKSTYVIDVTKRNTVGSIVSTMSSFMNIFSIYYQNRATAEICFW